MVVRVFFYARRHMGWWLKWVSEGEDQDLEEDMPFTDTDELQGRFSNHYIGEFRVSMHKQCHATSAPQKQIICHSYQSLNYDCVCKKWVTITYCTSSTGAMSRITLIHTHTWTQCRPNVSSYQCPSKSSVLIDQYSVKLTQHTQSKSNIRIIFLWCPHKTVSS